MLIQFSKYLLMYLFRSTSGFNTVSCFARKCNRWRNCQPDVRGHAKMSRYMCILQLHLVGTDNSHCIHSFLVANPWTLNSCWRRIYDCCSSYQLNDSCEENTRISSIFFSIFLSYLMFAERNSLLAVSLQSLDEPVFSDL